MAYVDDLTAQRTALMTAKTAAIAAGPSHTVSSKNGSTTFDNAAWLKQLDDQIQATNELIAKAQPFWQNERVYV